ncbi:MAG: bifunctional diaminohydroxyphosphoribosylaminopyrimidine deaminase/5-amino-6-(5-phosphoribosylamino)uracil reductase RibD [Janthinobacterium lividum]
MFSQDDFKHMQRALALATRAMYNTTPNPRVGCVLVKDGAVIGEGFTQPPGQDHAEVRALKDARSHGHDPAGATAYVTLEPCSHFGRTPPCARALVEARIERVIAAMEDPNPLVSGRGLEQLRSAGVDVRCGLLAREAQELNIGFISRMTRGRPWVRMKIAASLDGKTALPSGVSQWITGGAARADGHAWRARACAILTGVGTVRQDDPQLTVRGIETPRQPLRIIVDSGLALPPTARVLQGGALVICAVDDSNAEAAARAQALRDAGAEIVALPNADGKADLPALLRLLGERGINELHVEAGAKLNGSLMREDCVDELLLYFAPRLLGEGFGMLSLAPPDTLADARRLVYHSVERIGEDLRVIARLEGAGRTPPSAAATQMAPAAED